MARHDYTAAIPLSSSEVTEPFVSYAQNFEDVMLRRALRNVSRGCYLDVGAAEPEADSVTKAFYDLGWHGINVEPLEGPFERLVVARPRDVNLNVAVGFAPGEASLFVVGNESGLSTLHQAFAAQHEGGGWTLQERRVPVTTLAEICAAHVTGDLHFLKIDAEGAELDILRGADFRRWRPWIILLEAVDPVGHRPSPFREWEGEILTPSQYVFAYDDGLNRFYVAAEREAELGPAFNVPPNVFDNFVRISEVKASEQASQAEAIARLESLLHAAQERADLAQSRAHAAQASAEQERVAAAEAHAAQAEASGRLETLLHAAQERADLAQSRAHAAQASAEQERVAAAEAHAAQAEASGRLETLLHAAQERADLAQSRVHAAQASIEQEQARVAAAEVHAAHAQSASHDAGVRLNEMAAAVSQAKEWAAAADARCAEMEGAMSAQTVQVAQLRDNLLRASVERDGWAQELFETNRHAAELVVARQMLADELAGLRRHEEWRVAQVAGLESLLAAAQEAPPQLSALRDELTAAQNTAQHGEAALQRELGAVHAKLAGTVHELQHANQWLRAVRQSSSWRVTRPVRVVLRLLGRG